MPKSNPPKKPSTAKLKEVARYLGHLGGKSRAESQSPEVLSEIGKLGGAKTGRKGLAAMTPERRREIALKGVEARAQQRGQK